MDLPAKGSLEAKLVREAAKAMGLRETDMRPVYAPGGHFAERGPTTLATSGTGAAASQIAGSPGCRRLSVTGAGVGVSRELAGNIVGGWTSTTQPLFAKGRFKRSGTLAAGSDQHIGFQNSPFNHGVGIGVFQSISATNFSVVKCASDVYTGVDTGIAIDTNFHDFMLYRNTAGAWFWRIDSGALTSMTTTGQPTSGNEAYGHVHVTNAAAATALQLDYDYVFWASRKAA